MTTLPKVSIIIPCFNAASFLAQTLDSVFSQNYNAYELIIIDDGSTDNSRAIIDEYVKQHPEKIVAEYGPNRGVSAARNRGTELAKGIFIQYLDADDILKPGTIAKRVKTLETSGADVVYTDFQRLMEQKDGSYQYGKIVSRRIEDIHPSPEISLFTDFWVPPAAIIYSKEVIDKIGGWKENLPIIQDARFALDAALAGGKFEYIPSVEAYYRVSRGSSLSKRDPLRFHIDCFSNAQQIEQFWRKNGGLSYDRRKALSYVYGFTAEYLFWHDENLFNRNIDLLNKVQPEFIFSFAKVASKLSQLIGMKQARNIMPFLQHIKKKIKPSATFSSART